MKGDKLVITDKHRRAAQGVAEILLPQIEAAPGRFVITIAGESGSGKSEVAAVLSELLTARGIKNAILQLDDYFCYPPKTNDRMRREDISHVGDREVRIDLVDQNIRNICEGANEITKPLVIYDDDVITEEKLDLEGVKVVIVEGTYSTMCKNAHRRVFIDRTRDDTREVRRHRAREVQDDYLEKVLEIEHGIVCKHKKDADIIITRDYHVEKAGQGESAG